MSKDERNVMQDHTAPEHPRHQSPDHVLPPGPAEPGQPDFSPKPDRQSPGFSGVPGAGPNPSQPRP